MPILSGRLRRAVAALATSLLAGVLVVAVPVSAHADTDPASVTITSASSSTTPSFTVTGSFDYSGYDPTSSSFLGGGGLSSRAVIQVGVDATTVCEFDTSSSVWNTNTFSCEIGPLAVGQYTVFATLRDDLPGDSQAYARTSQDFIYDLPPVVTPPATVAPKVTITSGNTTSTATPTITGAYDSGTYVFPDGGAARGPLNIYNGSALICQVYSSALAASGTYSCAVFTPLLAGINNLQARLMDGTKPDPVAVANQTVTYIPPMGGPVMPPITPPVTPPATPSVTITSPATAASSSPTLSGTLTVGSWASEPRSVFEVYVGSDLVCTSSLSSPSLSGGTWTCAVGTLAPGTYSVFVRILADVLNTATNYSTAAQNLVIPSVVDPTIPSVTITSPSTATSNPPTFSGTFSTGDEDADQFALRVVVGEVPVCDESTDYLDLAAGTWSCTSDAALGSGEHTVTVELLFNGTSYPDLWPTSVATQSLAVPVTGTITGHVYNDANGNGIQDTDEPDISGVRVELWRMNESGTFDFFASTVTHSPYVFGSVPLGTYQVRVPAGTSPAGFATLGSAAVWTVTVTGSGTFTASAARFGFTPLTAELAYTGSDFDGLIRLASGFVMFGLMLAAAARAVRRRGSLRP
ncbi:MAG: hypothetical protein KKH51_14365 [Actinobacteria bacterium]|nr:hypothetical protein [Actinomycetota bacterium]